MQKFSKYTKEQNEPYQEATYTPVWENGDQRVVNFEGWNIFVEADKVCCIPYLQEYGCILLRLEPVPSYKLRNKAEQHLTCMSETIGHGETTLECLKRGLVEEFGIKLNDNCDVEFDTPFFQFKGGNTQVNCCLVPLMEHQYTDVAIKGDGSNEETASKMVKVDIKNLRALKPADLTTMYLINKMQMFLKP